MNLLVAEKQKERVAWAGRKMSVKKGIGELCWGCETREACLFMLIHDRPCMAKGHVCAECFHMIEAGVNAKVEAVSQQEFDEAGE